MMLSAMAFPAYAQAPREKIDVSKLGPQVGEKVPDFNLKDQYGTPRTLKSIMGPKGAMLVFVRSADWCPYCKTQLVDLQTGIEQLRKRGLGVATISYDPVEILAGFAKQHAITYTMLADMGSVTIKKFGLLNPAPEWALDPGLKDDPEIQAEVRKYVSVVGARPEMIGMAFPGNIVVDTEGRVKQWFFEDFYIERTEAGDDRIELFAHRQQRAGLGFRQRVAGETRQVMLVNRQRHVFLFAGEPRVVHAHHALQFGELADQAGEQVGLVDVRRALGVVEPLRRNLPAEEIDEFADARHFLGVAAELFMINDAVELFGEIVELLFLVGFPEIFRVLQPRQQHAAIAFDDRRRFG